MKRIIDRWDAVGTGSGVFASLARIIVYASLLFLAYECITIDFSWPEQAVLGGLTILLGYAIHRISRSEVITLALMFASILATGRYAYWRISTVATAIATQGRTIGIINIFFILLLLCAEFYAFVILFLGYIQTIRPLRRMPFSLPAHVEDWPDIDVLIPTYNEPLSVVRSTVFGAVNIDYPPDKLHVYVLDDGRRAEFRKFCDEAGVGYIIRGDNKHAKAGNINHALTTVSSPYVAIFDCDHIPTRSFLQMTLGWFLKDRKLAMLQTPHFFYSPDPFERNLNQFMVIPNEGELFYGLIQDGSDLWNATFFCGSCAILRRTALDEIGGIAVETVTEDAHTSLRMQMRGWNTAYINIPQAAGLATESLSGHVGQRIRWARGMIQILRTDNPLLVKGLKWPQRLCYFNAMVHFLYAGPRLIFLTSPLIYMLLGCINIPGHWAAILVYAFPHLFLANLTNFRMQGKYRHSFWNEVYETVLAPYILGPTILALVNPKLGKFNVTAKGGIVQRGYFDKHIARPYVALILLDILAILLAPVHMLYWTPGHSGTIAMNVVWILFNLVIVGTANAVAFESRQTRSDVRIGLQMPVQVRLADGRSLFGTSVDMSLGGASFQMEEPLAMNAQSRMRVIYPRRHAEVSFPARAISISGQLLRIQYEPLSVEEEEALTLVLYSGADTWLGRGERHQPDRPMRSLLRLVRLSVKGVGYALTDWIPKRKKDAKKLSPARAEAATLVIAALLLGMAHGLLAQNSVPAPGSQAASPAPGVGSFSNTFALRDIGIPEEIVFRGVDASRNVPFSLPQNEIAQQASLKLRYAFSPGLIPELSHMNVFLNGILISTLPVPRNTGEAQGALESTISIPAELLIRDNVLGFQFIGHYTQQCEDPSNSVLWGRIGNTSSISLSGSLLQLANDLKILPLPFYDGAVSSKSAEIPFAFAAAPPASSELTAAGVVASWFGVIAKSRPLHFPVTTGETLPKGNVVLFVTRSSTLLSALDLAVNGPVIAVRTNPMDPYGKVLVIAGNDSDQVLTAARALALGNGLIQGPTAWLSNFKLPDPRLADDAPIWMGTDRVASFGDYSSTTEMQTDGSGPVAVYLRVPPDLYFGDKQTLPIHLDYRYNPVSLANESTMRVNVNSSMVNELPLPHADAPKKELSYDLPVPLVNIRPFANTFLFNFYFQIAKKGNCQDTPPINLQGAVLRSSYLDLRGLSHWAAMPNLELFSNAGFPFTRFADLSRTRIVLPPAPTPVETSLYLTLMAYFGEQTGYPALRVQTGDSSLLEQDADYLILGTPTNEPAFARLKEKLPVAVRPDGFSVEGTGGFFSTLTHAWWQVAEMRPNWWWKLSQIDQRKGLISSLGQPPDALVQGIESPWAAGGSVVMISYRNDDAAEQFGAAFWKASMSGDISESVTVLHGTTFSSYRLGDRFYHVGHLPWWQHVRYWLREFPWLIVVLTFVLGIFVVPWIRRRLDRRARARLELQNV